jgi:NADH-quinone oxidoreductase subunit G
MHEAVSGENDIVVLFGAVVQGASLAHLRALAKSRGAEGKKTRFVALGDFANSRGAADMGMLPDRLPGYAPVTDRQAREAFGELWGCSPHEPSGLAGPAMLDAAVAGRIQALYVVGSNPVRTHRVAASGRLGKCELLVVHELFLTETARLADIVLPALGAYEKDGTMTNTTGEVQLVRKAADCAGPRSDYDILRILSHQLARHGVGQPIRLRTPEAAFDEIRRHVPGYDVSWQQLLAGGAQATQSRAANGNTGYEVPAKTIFSTNDNLFTSGSLTPYCRMIQSLREAEVKS